MAAVARRHARAALAVIGMAFYWPLLRREQALLFSADVDSAFLALSLEWLPFVLLGVSAAVMLVFGEQFAKRTENPLITVAVCLLTTVVNAAVLMIQAAGVSTAGLQVLRSAFFALSLLLLTVAWANYVVACDRNQTLLLAASFAVSFVFPLIGLLPEPSAFVVPVLAPLLSALAWYGCRRGMSGRISPPAPAGGDAPFSGKLPANAVGLLVAFLLLGSLVRGVFYSSELAASFTSVVPWLRGISLAFSAMILVLSALTKHRDRLYSTILTALAVLFFAGLFWVAASQSGWTHIGIAAIISGRTYLGFFLFATLLVETTRRRISRFSAVAIFLATEAVSGVLTYAIVPLMVSRFGLGLEEHLGMYSLGVALMLVACCFLFFTRDAEKAAAHDQRDSHEVSGAQPSALVVERLAEYGLTGREMEVLELLLHGHNYKKIGALLYISPNTVLSHTKQIYKKMGVHKKQQLIDLLTDTKQ